MVPYPHSTRTQSSVRRAARRGQRRPPKRGGGGGVAEGGEVEALAVLRHERGGVGELKAAVVPRKRKKRDFAPRKASRVFLFQAAVVPGAGERVDDDVQCVAVVDAEKIWHILKQQRRRPASTDTGSSPQPPSSLLPPASNKTISLRTPSKELEEGLVCVRRSSSGLPPLPDGVVLVPL